MSRAYSVPIGMFVVISFTFSFPKEVSFSRVSVLTKGTIVSKFLGYLYSLGSGKNAEVIECDYSLPKRLVSWSFHFLITPIGPRKARASRREASHAILDVIFTSDGQPPIWFEDEPERLGGGSGNSAQPTWNTKRKTRDDLQDPSVFVAMRHVLMMTAFNIPPLGILVALNQADEVLRQDRNTYEEIT